MPAIILSTLNARYIHASLGLRYLLANLGELRTQTVLREFTIARATTEIVDELLAIADIARSMQIKTGCDLAEARQVAAEGARIRMALDGAGTAMTISNENNVLIYMNDAARRLWTEMTPAMRQRVPSF